MLSKSDYANLQTRTRGKRNPSDKYEVIGEMRLSQSGKNIVIYVKGEFVGFCGKNIIEDVAHRRMDYCKIYKSKTE